jgi:hypothetical protein
MEMSTNMKNERNTNGMNRRLFLQTSAKCAASAMFLSLGSAPSFAAPNASTQKNLIPLVTLNNGLKMPRLGFGTMTLNGDVGIRCVADAISLGYRLIDTAMIYGTETSVGTGSNRVESNVKNSLSPQNCGRPIWGTNRQRKDFKLPSISWGRIIWTST